MVFAVFANLWHYVAACLEHATLYWDNSFGHAKDFQFPWTEIMKFAGVPSITTFAYTFITICLLQFILS